MMSDLGGSRPTAQLVQATSILPSSRTEWIALIGLVAALIMLRLPFINTWQPNGDSANYALGALRTHVAHPPGSIGYCLVVGWLDKIVGQVFTSMLILGLASVTAGIIICHLLGKAIGLRWPAALLGAAVYGASLNTLASSVVCLPHVIEGMFACLFALLAVLAITRSSSSLALGGGLILAIAGAFRPTTTLFLIPAWLFLLWAVKPRRAGLLCLHIFLFVAIVASWHFSSEHYMTKAGFGGVTFDLQAMMPSGYEYATLSSTPVRFSSARPTYHMPWFEAASWLDQGSGLKILPHKADWPAPSLKRATILLFVQTCKFSYFLIVSAPAFIVAMLVWASGKLGRRRDLLPPAKVTLLLTFCLFGPVLLFIFGHMGAMEYLQLIMPVTSVLAVYVLFPRFTDQYIPQTNSVSTSPWLKTATMVAMIASGLGMLFFIFGRPLPLTSKFNRAFDTVLGHFTGYAIKYNTGNVNRNSQGEWASPFDAVRTDAEFLRVVDETDFSPVPDMLRTPPVHRNNNVSPSDTQ